jgi:glycine cleavage system H protein
MAEERTFLMGKFPALLPGGLLYARNHMWCRPQERHGGRSLQEGTPVGNALRGVPEGRCCRFGFTSYAVRLMQDVYFLEWHLEAGEAVEFLQQIGHIETSKAVSDLFAPLAGVVRSFNRELLKDPSGINVDGYGGGWLFELDADPAPLMDVEQYHQFLAANWEKTQQHIKGKINTED